jgi:hypothetical protein
VSLESLREHVGVFFQLDKAQSAPDVDVRKKGLLQDDIILGRVLKQCELEVSDEASAMIHRLKI